MVIKNKEFNSSLFAGLLAGLVVYWSQIFYDSVIDSSWNIFFCKAILSLFPAIIIFIVFLIFQRVFERD